MMNMSPPSTSGFRMSWSVVLSDLAAPSGGHGIGTGPPEGQAPVDASSPDIVAAVAGLDDPEESASARGATAAARETESAAPSRIAAARGFHRFPPFSRISFRRRLDEPGEFSLRERFLHGLHEQGARVLVGKPRER